MNGKKVNNSHISIINVCVMCVIYWFIEELCNMKTESLEEAGTQREKEK